MGKKRGKTGDRHPQSVSPRDLYDHSFDTVGGRNPAPLYLHPKTNPRTPSLTLGQCLVVRKKEKLNDQNPAPPQ